MEGTRERIVSAARHLFGEYGFRGTTTAQLARAAEVAEGTIYRHFKDKKDLFIACLAPVVAEAIRRETSVIEGGSPREVLRRRMIERVRVIRENLDVFDILFTEAKHHPEIAEILISQLAQSVPMQEWAMLNALLATGTLKRSPNPLIMNVGLTAAIWAMVRVGPAADQLFAQWPAPVRFDQLEEDVADFVCAALMGENDQPATPVQE